MNQDTIYVWGGTRAIKSFSPFCMKAIYAAKLKGISPKIAYVTLAMPAWAKKGTLPVATLQGQNIEDSSAIFTTLDTLYPQQPLLYPKDESLKLETHLLEDWADEYLASLGVVYRWKVDQNYNKFAKDAFGKMPWVLRTFVLPLIRKETVNTYAYRTAGAASDAERLELLQRAVKIVAHKLGQKPFLIYDQITAADLAVYCVFEQAAWVSEIKDVIDTLHQYPLLLEWMNRIKTTLQ